MNLKATRDNTIQKKTKEHFFILRSFSLATTHLRLQQFRLYNKQRDFFFFFFLVKRAKKKEKKKGEIQSVSCCGIGEPSSHLVHLLGYSSGTLVAV